MQQYVPCSVYWLVIFDKCMYPCTLTQTSCTIFPSSQEIPVYSFAVNPPVTPSQPQETTDLLFTIID